MWLKTISKQFKNTARQLNNSIRKSSYPSKLEFPLNQTICDNNCFKLHYAKKILCATEAAEISNNENGTAFLKLTESTPAKSGFDSTENHDAKLTYHIFSLAKNGNLTYMRFEENVNGNDLTENLTKTIPGSASKKSAITLTRNVESIHCSKTDTTDSNGQQSLKIVINCKIPKGETSRSETTVATPNVEMIGDL